MKIYRSLRSEELNDLYNNRGLRAHCDNCKCKDCILEECCKINDRQHVNSGSRANTKSRYISTTRDEKIAAWWSANIEGNPKYTTTGKSASYVEIDIDINNPPNPVIDTRGREYGATANNRAKSSREVLIKDDVPMKYITSIYRVRQILKNEFDSIPDSYNKNGFLFKKIYYNVKKKDKYMLVLKLPEVNFDIRYDNFPKDYLLNDIHKTNIESEEDKMDSSGWITEVEHPTPERQFILPPQSSIIQNTQQTKTKKIKKIIKPSVVKSSNHSIKSKREQQKQLDQQLQQLQQRKHQRREQKREQQQRRQEQQQPNIPPPVKTVDSKPPQPPQQSINETTKIMNTKYTDELKQKYNLDISEVRDYLRQPAEDKFLLYLDEDLADEVVARTLVIIFRFMGKDSHKDNVVSYYNDNRYSYPFETFIEDIKQRNPNMNSHIVNIIAHYFKVVKAEQKRLQQPRTVNRLGALKRMEGSGKKKKTRKKKQFSKKKQTKRNKK